MIRIAHLFIQPRGRCFVQLVLTIWAFCVSHLAAQTTAEKPPVAQREIFVPLDELHVILEAETQRVFMKRAEYEQLLLDAQLKAKAEPPLAKLLTGASYIATLEPGRAVIRGELSFELFTPGLHLLPLPFNGVGIRQVTLDAKATPLAHDAKLGVVLPAEGVGRHTLQVELTAPLVTTAARQTLQLELPTAPASTFRVSVPGNVEIKSGAAIVRREVDEQKNVTQLDLALNPGPLALAFSLNNKQLAKDRIVIARGVLVDEVTSAYERLHATVSLIVLHGSLPEIKLAMPTGFEVTSVQSPHVSRWEMKGDDLVVTFREAVVEPVTLELTATRYGPPPAGWKFPRLAPRDVASQAFVLGVAVEDRWEIRQVAPEGLIPIDTAVLTNAMPESVFAPGAGLPGIRPVVAYYAPHDLFGLSAEYQLPSPALEAITTTFLTISEAGQRAEVGLALRPRGEKRFHFELFLPPDWELVDVRRDDQGPLTVERFLQPDRSTRLLLTLPAGAPAEQVTPLTLQAKSIPAAWLRPWNEQTFAYPIFRIQDAARSEGAIALLPEDDLELRPDQIMGLSPLTSVERDRYKLEAGHSTLAYRYEGVQPPATFRVTKRTPTLTAETWSFFQLKPGALAAHYELMFNVRDAATHELAFALPESTPAEISIRGLESAVVKETNSSVKEGLRHWRVTLAQRAQGAIKLAVDWEQHLEQEEPRGLVLPQIVPQRVEYYTGLIAVEGHPELETTVVKHPRQVDEGELSVAEYQVGTRLVGAYEFLAPADVVIDVTRHPGHALPSALAQRVQLVTQLSAAGHSQTEATYTLRSKNAFLEIELPAASKLWTITLNDRPTKPQRHNERLLLSLPSGSADQVHVVKIVYEKPLSEISWLNRVSLGAPRLWVRVTQQSEATEVYAADAAWSLLLPPGYELRGNSGSVDTAIAVRRPALVKLLTWLHEWGDAAPGAVQLAADIELSDWQPAHANVTSAPKYAYPETKSEAPAPAASEALPEPAMELAEERAGAKQPGIPAADLPAKKLAGKAELPPHALPPPASKPQNDNMAELAKPRDDKPALHDLVKETKDTDQYRQATTFDKKQLRLEGVAGLLIGLQPTPHASLWTLTSLGDAPRVEATLVPRTSLLLLGWGVGIACFAWGLLLLRGTLTQQLAYVFGVMIIATLAPLFLPVLAEIGELFDGACFGAALCGLWFGIAAWWRTLAESSRAGCQHLLGRFAWLLGHTSVWLCLLCAGIESSSAQEPVAPVEMKSFTLDKLLPLLADELRPIKVPADAVIVPYDSNDPKGVEHAEQVMLAYPHYFKLWNQAYPDKKLAGPEPPISYALGAAKYELSLQEAEQAEVRGSCELVLFTAKPVSIPLPLAGGVLVSALVDDKPARVQFVMPEDKSAPPLAVLHVQGIGQHRFQFTYRLPWSRTGGWRELQGTLPAQGGARFQINPPTEAADLRLKGFIDREAFETKAGEGSIATALAPAGTFNVAWRPKVLEGITDRGLSVKANAVFDVRQDVLRLTTQLEFLFPRGRRERFTLQVPTEYPVERVTGPNVRGWQATEAGGNRQIEVTLLKEITEREEITVTVARYGAVGQGEMELFRVPLIQVPGAELQQGTVVLRRDDRLDVRVNAAEALTREDAELAPQLAQAADAYDVSLLPVRVFQAYRYVSLPVLLRLAAEPHTDATEAETRLIWNVGERLTSVETNVIIKPRGLPVQRVDLLLPADWSEIEAELSVAGGFEKNITKQGDRQLLSLLLRAGQTTDFSVLITANGAQRTNDQALTAPALEVLNVVKQSGSLGVQVDPAYDAQWESTNGCETLPVNATYGWLSEGKRATGRLALRWSAPGYTAALQVKPKLPQLETKLLHNVKVTAKTLEQTTLVEYRVSQAGIREVTVLLPAALRTARIKARNVRRQSVEEKGDKIPAGFVRLRVELEDEFLGQYQLLLEHDRLLTSSQQTLSLPALDQGTGRRRLVMIESAGRDEVVIEKTEGLEPLTRGQQAFTELVAALGAEPTQGYIAKQDAETPSLTLALKQRETVATAAARIGLAETMFVMDRSGAYRARQEYRVDNSSEQYLEVSLPTEAQLWSVLVDGQAAKPVQGAKGVVRIPIIRRARGDADYKVALIYAGRLPSIQWWGETIFPFPKTVNIQVERSVVRLFVPDSHEWFGFTGTLGTPVNEVEVQKTAQEYLKSQLLISKAALDSGDAYDIARAQNNLKQVELEFQQLQQGQRSDAELSTLNASNEKALHAQIEQGTRSLQEDYTNAAVDNRERFGRLFQDQQLSRAKNVVGNESRNFYNSPQKSKSAEYGLNSSWFESNKLESKGKKADTGKSLSRLQSIHPNQPTTEGKESGAALTRNFKNAARPNQGPGQLPADGASSQQAGERLSQVDQQRQKQQTLERYQQKLSQTTDNSRRANAAPNTDPSSSISQSGPQLAFGAMVPPTVAPPQTATSAPVPQFNAPAGGGFGGGGELGNQFAGVPSSVPYASLQLDIPQRGTEFRFTTVRGDLAIRGRHLNRSVIQNVWTILFCLVSLGLIGILLWLSFWINSVQRYVGPSLLIMLGMLSVMLPMLPFWGWLALLMGSTLLLRQILLDYRAPLASPFATHR